MSAALRADTPRPPPAPPPPITSQRWQSLSLDHFIDDFMAGIPHARIDLESPGNRSKFRSYLKVRMGHFLRDVMWDFQKGAERGIAQVAQLIEDPAYYQTVSKRRAAERARFKADQERQDREGAERREKALKEREKLQKSGKLKVFARPHPVRGKK